MRGVRSFAAALAIILVAIAVFKLNERAIGLAIYERMASARVGHSAFDDLPNGLHAAVCGSASPMPAPGRAGPCIVVRAGETTLMVDAGAGGARTMTLMNISPGAIDAIMLTHLHSDHIDGLGEAILQSWATDGRDAPLPVIGPEGTDDVVAGVNAAYKPDGGYRVAHHGPDIIPPAGFGGLAEAFDVAEGGSAVVYEGGGLTVTAFDVDHEPAAPAVGYRFDYEGRSVVVSGDTSYDENLVVNADGADLLFHDGLQRDLVGLINKAAADAGDGQLEAITHDILDYHATPEEAAEAAARAGVRHLVFYHLIPALPSRLLYPAFLGDAPKAFEGEITVSEDGMLFSLPAGSEEIILTRLM